MFAASAALRDAATLKPAVLGESTLQRGGLDINRFFVRSAEMPRLEFGVSEGRQRELGALEVQVDKVQAVHRFPVRPFDGEQQCAHRVPARATRRSQSLIM